MQAARASGFALFPESIPLLLPFPSNLAPYTGHTYLFLSVCAIQVPIACCVPYLMSGFLLGCAPHNLCMSLFLGQDVDAIGEIRMGPLGLGQAWDAGS